MNHTPYVRPQVYLTVETSLLFESFPHGDLVLGALPKFGFKFVVTNVKLLDFFGMYYDVMRSMLVRRTLTRYAKPSRDAQLYLVIRSVFSRAHLAPRR